MEILSQFKDDTTVCQHDGKYYLYYKVIGRRMDKPWVLVTQPDNKRVEWFGSETELCEYIETL